MVKAELGDKIWLKQNLKTRFGKNRTWRQDLVKIELGDKIWLKQNLETKFG